MKLKTITAMGDPYSLGRSIGEAIAPVVQQVTIHNEEMVTTEKIWTGSDYVEKMMAASRREFPKYVRELEGMADGMDISYERAFLWNCRGDLRWPDDITPAMAADLSEGCTTLIMPATQGHPSIIAHNEDGSADYHEECFWLSIKPENGPAVESFLYPGMMAGHTMGANSAGIVQTINNIRVHDLKPGIPRHFICRAILDCTSMDEALALLKRQDRAAGFHHNLGSAAEGRLASVEAPASGCAIREITETPRAHANHLIRPELKDTPQSITQSSSVRQARADQLLDQNALKNGDPTNILFDHKPGHEILRSPTDGGDDYGQTLATGIFSLSQSAILIDIKNGPSSESIFTKNIGYDMTSDDRTA